MSDLFPEVTPDEMIAEVEREIAMRRQVYPRLQANAGRSKVMEMDRRLHVMLAVLETLKTMKAQGFPLP
jgi:hypothetical protein